MADFASQALSGWLAAIGEMGWRRAGLADAARISGLSADDIRARLGDRVDALVALQDRVAAEAAAGAAEAQGSVRDRLFDGLMRGFDAAQADRAAVLAIWASRDPGVLLLLGGRGGLHVRRLAQSAGIDVAGPRGQLRLAALGALIAQAFAAWRRDDSADMSATMAELDRLLERAERAETEGVSPDLLGLPGLSSLFNRLRMSRGSGDPAPPPSADPAAE
jgi:ubiquinone biosynthesis protein COQ9